MTHRPCSGLVLQMRSCLYRSAIQELGEVLFHWDPHWLTSAVQGLDTFSLCGMHAAFSGSLYVPYSFILSLPALSSLSVSLSLFLFLSPFLFFPSLLVTSILIPYCLCCSYARLRTPCIGCCLPVITMCLGPTLLFAGISPGYFS